MGGDQSSVSAKVLTSSLVWHDCFNAADVDAVVRVEVTAREPFAHMIDALLRLHVRDAWS